MNPDLSLKKSFQEVVLFLEETMMTKMFEELHSVDCPLLISFDFRVEVNKSTMTMMTPEQETEV